MSSPTAAEYTRGALYGLAAVSIWSGWIVVARLGLSNRLPRASGGSEFGQEPFRRRAEMLRLLFQPACRGQHVG